MPRRDITTRTARKKVDVVDEVIPPHEAVVGAGERILNDRTVFFAHRRLMTKSDLIEMGYDPDVVWELPCDSDGSLNEEAIEARGDEDPFLMRGENALDPASHEVMVTEAFIRVDVDGDGIAEKRRIVCGGDTEMKLLDNDPIEFMPCSSLCAIPMPSRFFGLSPIDLVMDLQVIRSTLMRIILDNAYLTNNPVMGVVDGQAELDAKAKRG